MDLQGVNWFAVLSTLAAVAAAALVVARAVAGARRWKKRAQSPADTELSPAPGQDISRQDGTKPERL